MTELNYIWAIGDIHGMKSQLSKLLWHLLENYKESQFIFLGDYIDRGNDSKGVLDIIMSMPESIYLMGNHEQILLDIVYSKLRQKEGTNYFYSNGGAKTLQSFGCKDLNDFIKKVPQKYIDFLSKLKYSYLYEYLNFRILFIHAGLIPNVPLLDQLNVNDLDSYHAFIEKYKLKYNSTFLWVRKEFYSSDPNNWQNSLVVHGHTPVSHLKDMFNKPPHLGFNNHFSLSNSNFFEYAKFNDNLPFFRLKKNLLNSQVISINLDTGCGYNNRLTAIGFDISNANKNKIPTSIVQCGSNKPHDIFEFQTTISL